MRTLLWAVALAAAAGAADNRIVYKALPAATIQERLEKVRMKLADRRAAMEALFQEVGCTDARFAELPVPGSKAPDQICTLSGETDSEIVVGGHYDSIEEGMGAIDDWSGASMLPSLYQSLKEIPRHHRFVFVAFSGEERGLLGSHEFVKKLPHDRVARIHAMINLECLGVGPPEIWLRRADKGLADAYAQIAAILHVEPRAMNVDGAGDDDSHPFLNAKIPVLTIHSLDRESLGLLHSPRDTLFAIHADEYYSTYKLVAAYLAYLDNTLA